MTEPIKPLDLPDLAEPRPDTAPASGAGYLLSLTEPANRAVIKDMLLILVLMFVAAVSGLCAGLLAAALVKPAPVTHGALMPHEGADDSGGQAGHEAPESGELAVRAVPDSAPADDGRLERLLVYLDGRFGGLEARLLAHETRLTAINLQLDSLAKTPPPRAKTPNRAARTSKTTTQKVLPPFKLIVVDLWEQSPVVFINDEQADTIERLFLSFTYKSWRLVAADWERQEARFEHIETEQQHVLRAIS